MNLQLTEEQYRYLAMLVCLGDWVRGGVADQRGENHAQWEKARDRILFEAINQDIPGVAEIFEGHIVPSDELANKYEEIIAEYDDDNFWHELSLRLGQRDYEREATVEDAKYSDKHYGMLPEKAHKYYEKYDDEFEQYGIDRLKVVEE